MNRPEDIPADDQHTPINAPPACPSLNSDIGEESVEAALEAAFGRSRLRGEFVSPRQGVYVAQDVIAGRFRLIEQIGTGGMGTVWYAEQLSPVKRKVAIKLIKPGLDSQSILARFDAERQALALMDHPNIAKVFDGGVTELGHPFFAMELVRGTAITTWCDENRVGLRGRLELLIPVCQAIQHAHQKGVIHRDIKPSNIMVGLFDGVPVPKVIDFGVAKAFDATLTEMSLQTDFGAVVGTVEYMSPEQAELNNLDIDTRSDVYSLGVLMYELLAGTTPFSRAELAEFGWHEILRVIREVDPQLPSVRLSTSKMRANIAAQRNIEPVALGRLLKSELDWIVMKALEKERSRRYESASAMAGDLQRYLRDEAVEACPPSSIYRIRKFVRRHRWQVVVAGMMLICLVVGILGTSWGLIRAEAQRKLAEQARIIADRRTEGERVAKLEARRQQRLAEDAEDATLESYRASTDEAVEKLIISKTFLTGQERAYLENALKRWQAYANRKGDDPRSREIRAEAHFRVGSIWESLGDLRRTQEEYEAACATVDKLVLEFPEGTYRFQAARYRRNLANTVRRLGALEEAEVHVRLAIAGAEKLVEDIPDEPKFEQELIRDLCELGQVLSLVGNHHEAELTLRKATAMQVDLVNRYPDASEFRLSLAVSFFQTASLLTTLGRSDSREHFEQALSGYERLIADDPNVLIYRTGLSACLTGYGLLLANENDVTKAEQMLLRAQEECRSLTEEFPSSPQLFEDLANCHQNLGWFLCDRKSNTDEAENEYRAALGIREQLAEKYPTRDYRSALARSHFTLGFILSVQDKSTPSRLEFLKALEIRKQLASEAPGNLAINEELSWTYYHLGELELNVGNLEEALSWFDRAVATGTALLDESPEVRLIQTLMQYSFQGRAKTKRGLQIDDQADWNESLKFIPDDGLPRTILQRVSVLMEAHRYEAALPELDKLLQLPSDAGQPVWSQVDYYNLACICAAISPNIGDRQQEFELRAVSLLIKAVDHGFSDVAFMNRDKTLDPLRKLPEFDRLMERVKSPTDE